MNAVESADPQRRFFLVLLGECIFVGDAPRMVRLVVNDEEVSSIAQIREHAPAEGVSALRPFLDDLWPFIRIDRRK